jgi:predicted Zn-dependent protease
MLSFVLLLGVVGVIGLRRAWRETTLREADLPQLEAMARRSPDDGRLLALLGARLADAREYTAAAQMLERAVTSGEQDEATFLTWAAAVAASGDPVKARAVLRLGMSNPRLTPRLKFAFEESLKLGPHPPADALADAICPQGTKRLIASRTQGSFLNGLAAWWGRRHPEKSGFATRERWAQEQPKNLKAQRLWVDALLRNRRLAEAEEATRHALALAPQSAEWRVLLGDVLTRREALGKAGLEYVAALKLRKNYLPALLGLGNVALEKKLLSMGVEVFERAVKQDPKSAEAWIGLARAYYNQRINLGKSLEAFRKAERLAPRRTDYFGYYSDALRVNFRFDDAENVLRRRLKSAPGDARCHFLLATLLLEYKPSLQREADAEAALRASLRLQPNVPAVEARLGDLLLRRGKSSEAITLLQSALEGDPHNLVALTTLVRAYRQTGRDAESKAAQQKLDWLSHYTQQVAFLEDRARRQPLNAKVHADLAQLYARGGETEKAEREREMAYMLQTRPQEARRGVSALSDATSIVTGEPKR